jgi:Lrp/AsnC family leucine-responsive transcriptional regulator
LDADRLLDDVSWRLLGELQERARLTYSELGRRVGLTPPAVAERIRRLEEAGIITGYRDTLNPEKVGFPLTAFIRISLVDGKCA